MQAFACICAFCENRLVAVFDPNRKRNARGEQRQQNLLRAAAAVFGRLGYHETTTNAIAAAGGQCGRATLYQFFPNKEAIASALASMYAQETGQGRAGKFDLKVVLSFTRCHPRLDRCLHGFRIWTRGQGFTPLAVDAPLSAAAREDKRALGEVFVDFIAARLRRERPTLSRSEASHQGQVALMIFRGILDEFTTASPSARTRLQQAMRDAILRYLEPVITQTKTAERQPFAENVDGRQTLLLLTKGFFHLRFGSSGKARTQRQHPQ